MWKNNYAFLMWKSTELDFLRDNCQGKPANHPQKGKVHDYREGKGNRQRDAGLDSVHVLSHWIFPARAVRQELQPPYRGRHRLLERSEFGQDDMAGGSKKAKKRTFCCLHQFSGGPLMKKNRRLCVSYPLRKNLLKSISLQPVYSSKALSRLPFFSIGKDGELNSRVGSESLGAQIPYP